MEFLMFVVALGIVGVLSSRFGYDSRVTAPSQEEELAGFGISQEAGAYDGNELVRARPRVA
jgi:hypothetical protein